MAYNTGIWGESREGVGAFWFGDISFALLSATVDKTLDFAGNTFTFSATTSSSNLGSDWTTLYRYSYPPDTITSLTSVQHTFDSQGYYNWRISATVYNSYGDALITSSLDGIPVRVNPSPYISFIGSPNLSSTLVFQDDSGSLYYKETIVSADWDFGDGNTSSTTDLTASFNHAYYTKGTFTVSLSVYDISGHMATDTVSISVLENSSCTTSVDYITLCGPNMLGRFGACRNINLVEYLPLYLRGGETEEFLVLFEEFLNNMYSGLCGWQTTSTELPVTQDSILTNAKTESATAELNFSYDVSGTSASTEATKAEQLSLEWPTNALYPTSAQKISILEKVARITELHDPSLIDIEYIQFFASNLGYSVNVSRDEVGVSGTTTESFGTTEYQGDCNESDINRYLRFVVENLPTWYKIKTTRNAVKVMLYSFGLVGDLIEYFTDNYKQTSDGGSWRADFSGNLNEIDNDWFPTPHFAIYIDFDLSSDITFELQRRNKVVRAIESIRPINTVFRRLVGFVIRRFDFEAACYMRSSRYTVISSNGYSNDWPGYIDLPEWVWCSTFIYDDFENGEMKDWWAFDRSDEESFRKHFDITKKTAANYEEFCATPNNPDLSYFNYITPEKEEIGSSVDLEITGNFEIEVGIRVLIQTDNPLDFASAYVGIMLNIDEPHHPSIIIGIGSDSTDPDKNNIVDLKQRTPFGYKNPFGDTCYGDTAFSAGDLVKVKLRREDGVLKSYWYKGSEWEQLGLDRTLENTINISGIQVLSRLQGFSYFQFQADHGFRLVE